MKAIEGLVHCNRKKIFVVLAVSLFLLPAAGVASPSLYPFYSCHNPHLTVPSGQPPVIDWVLDKSVGNVDFYHALTVCNGNKVVFLKFNNKNRHPVKVTWKEVFKTPSAEKKDGFAGKKELVLSPGITTPGDCSDAENKKNILLPSQVDPTGITEILDFSFKEITVNPL